LSANAEFSGIPFLAVHRREVLVDAAVFLKSLAKSKPQPIYVLSGDEEFLRRRCREAIISHLLGASISSDDSEFAVSVFPSPASDFSVIRNELDTRSFFSPTRIVVVEQADPFITQHRVALEAYAAKPSSIGILILEPKTFPETTRLAKQIPDAGKAQCKAPPEYKLVDWCIDWAKSAHGQVLSPDAAGMLVARVSPSLGLFAQEIEKLALAVGPRAIAAEDVDRLVGRSREANVFKILDAIGEGKPAEALTILRNLLEEGNDPLGILGPMTYQLRKLAAVGKQIQRGMPLGAALDAAGVPKWPQARQATERQVKHLGRRLDQLTDWLVDMNLGLKGGNPLPPQVQLEMFIVKLAKPRVN
jgi:DNA polymerase-3 subunit delta